MTVKCAWCGAAMKGTADPVAGVSHGMCDVCAKEFARQMREPAKNPPHPQGPGESPRTSPPA
jgi:hypothetical protein